MIKHTLSTFILLAGLGSLFCAFGYLLGGTDGLLFAFVAACCINALTLFFGDSFILTVTGAQPLQEELYPSVYASTRELCRAMNLPMPRLWLLPSNQANAFATGRSPRNASVALSQGIITLLEPHEIRGVIAHELAHIKNRDIIIATLAATIATALSYLSHYAQRLFFMQSFDKNNRNKQASIIGFLISAIVMPLAAMIIQLSISRSREYLADETGAHYSSDPLALASALEKLEQSSHQSAAQEASAVSSLFIVQHLSGGWMVELFSTHPPIYKRVARLRALYEKRFNF